MQARGRTYSKATTRRTGGSLREIRITKKSKSRPAQLTGRRGFSSWANNEAWWLNEILWCFYRVYSHFHYCLWSLSCRSPNLDCIAHIMPTSFRGSVTRSSIQHTEYTKYQSTGHILWRNQKTTRTLVSEHHRVWTQVPGTLMCMYFVLDTKTFNLLALQ